MSHNALLQLPGGPELFMLLLVCILFVIPGGLALIVIIGFRRRKSAEKTDTDRRIEELERRVDELERNGGGSGPGGPQ